MSLPSVARLAAVGFAGVAFLVLSSAQAQPKNRSDCESCVQASGRAKRQGRRLGADPDELVDKMLRMAKTTAQDYVIDLAPVTARSR